MNRAAFDAAQKHMGGPFLWFTSDCCKAACCAWASLWGRDPLAAFTGRYTTAKGALRILRRSGGYLAWCDEIFSASGVARSDHAGPGDLALVQCDGPFGAALALCINPYEYAVKTERGFTVRCHKEIGAWTCRF